MIRATYIEQGKVSSVRARKTFDGWECLFFIQGTVCDGVWLGINEDEDEKIVRYTNPHGWVYTFKFTNSDNKRCPPTIDLISYEHLQLI